MSNGGFWLGCTGGQSICSQKAKGVDGGVMFVVVVENAIWSLSRFTITSGGRDTKDLDLACYMEAAAGAKQWRIVGDVGEPSQGSCG